MSVYYHNLVIFETVEYNKVVEILSRNENGRYGEVRSKRQKKKRMHQSCKAGVIKSRGSREGVRHSVMESSTLPKQIRETKVLVLYTGGTIGMKKTDGGKGMSNNFPQLLPGVSRSQTERMITQ